METVKVIVECGKGGKYSAFMDCYDYDFGLSGFGDTVKEAISDFYSCVEDKEHAIEYVQLAREQTKTQYSNKLRFAFIDLPKFKKRKKNWKLISTDGCFY